MYARLMAGEKLTKDSPLIASKVTNGLPTRLDYPQYTKIIKKIGILIGKPDATPYSLRRGAASFLLSIPGVTELQKNVFLRHSIFSLSAYLHRDIAWSEGIIDMITTHAHNHKMNLYAILCNIT